MYRERINATNQNPHVSVDCVIFGFDGDDLKVLLIERNYDGKENQKPIEKDLSLPGDLIFDDEDLDVSAHRVLKELTNLENIFLEQFRTFGNPNRVQKSSDANWLQAIRNQPTARVITVAYYSVVKLHNFIPTPDSFAKKADWYSIKNIPELAFDHNEIVEQALKSLSRKIQTHPIGFELLPQKFTLSQLQKLYESILLHPLDKRNFRRQMTNQGILKPLQEKQTDVPHKRAQLFSFDKAKYDLLNKEDYEMLK
jgi:8-oxo-dGTP diphosphatase